MSGTVEFSRNETSKSIWVLVHDDAHDESTETMELRLNNAEGGELRDGTATGRIHNTDPMPGRGWCGTRCNAGVDDSSTWEPRSLNDDGPHQAGAGYAGDDSVTPVSWAPR